jgi:hypothetical protein
MAILFLVLGAVVVFVIAAVVIGRESSRLGHEPRSAVIDIDEAMEHVADRLDDEHAARITYDEVRHIVRAYLDHLDRRGVSAAPGRELPAASESAGPVVVDDDALAAALERVDDTGLDVTDADVLAVVDLIVDYLAAVGAVGPRAETRAEPPSDPFDEP